jgi:hypothetical protein
VTGQNPEICMEIFRYYGKLVKDFDFVSIQKKTAVYDCARFAPSYPLLTMHGVLFFDRRYMYTYRNAGPC